MKTVPILAVALVATAVIAAEATWPSKGDTVYIAAAFKGLTPKAPIAGAQVNFDMPPCAEVEITKATPEKSKWTMRDPLGGSENLEGPWLPRMHKTKAECESQVAAEGAADVVRSGTTFTIKPAAPKKS